MYVSNKKQEKRARNARSLQNNAYFCTVLREMRVRDIIGSIVLFPQKPRLVKKLDQRNRTAQATNLDDFGKKNERMKNEE